MRRVVFSIALCLSILMAYGADARAQNSTFTTNLSLGSSGAQVTALQKLLNTDPETRIANTGPGSPGQETSYFGLLTKAAVIRFQQKYASDVLTPVKLSQGNGFVGALTRAKLTSLETLAKNSPSNSLPSAVEPAPLASGTSTAVATPTAVQNPNLIHIAQVTSTIEKVGAQQGMSPAYIAKLNQQIVAYASATTTDLRTIFSHDLQNKSRETSANDSFLTPVFQTIEHAFASVFMPERAFAQESGGGEVDTPFGGVVLFTFPCTCSDNGDWFVVLDPVGPSYVAILETAISVGIFSNYNIPFTSAMIGNYSDQTNGCAVGIDPYCYDVPVEGQIAPETGSAL